MRFSVTAILLCCTVWSSAAQTAHNPVAPEPPPPKGSVYGKVTADDTQRPAPFADISLVRIPQPGEVGYWNAGDPSKLKSTEVMVSGRTNLDGTYMLAEVPVGEYWFLAQSAGYILPLSTHEEAGKTPHTAAERAAFAEKMMADVPRVRVNADRSVEMNATMHRGAVIAGRVTLEDGTPLGSVGMKLRPAEGTDPTDTSVLMALNQVTYRSRNFTTDDRGVYRITGVSPGKYLVQLSFQAGGGSHMMGSGGSYQYGPSNIVWLTFYAPGTVHKNAGQTLEVKGSEQFNDIDLRVKLDTMHTVAGTVLHKEDRGPINSGYVLLKDPADEDWDRYGVIDARGGFSIPFVPEGTYTLSVRNAADAGPAKDPARYWDTPKLKTYQQTKQTILVAGHDLKVEDIFVEEKKTEENKGGAAASGRDE